MNKSTRALSTIVSSAILLSAVAMLGIGLVSWSQSNLTDKQTALETAFSINVNKLNEDVLIEHIWFGGTGPTKFLNVTLSNTGLIGLNVTEIKLVNSTTNAKIATYPITNGGMQPDEYFSTNFLFDWNSNKPFNVVVTTYRDVIFQTQVLPP